jgi:hypothetical protein
VRRCKNFFFLTRSHSLRSWGATSSDNCQSAQAYISCATRVKRYSTSARRRTSESGSAVTEWPIRTECRADICVCSEQSLASNFRECVDELSALAQEAALLRSLRPKFNRVGTWSAPPRFFAWRCFEKQLHFAVVETPDSDWRSYGPLGGGAGVLRAVLARLVWVTVHPQLGLAALPNGWFHGILETETTIRCGPMIEPVACKLG